METIERHEEILQDHEGRLRIIEKDSVGMGMQIKHLCEKLDSLIKTNQWLIGILVAELLGFFFYAVKSGIFK
jgi:hypothetical protein